jgi:predicted DNA-binding protein (MmcQ/YjbR family)
VNLEYFYEFCNSKPGVTEHFPFDEDTLVFKVGGKIFALSNLSGWENGNPSVNLKGKPEHNEVHRVDFEDITPGYHMSKVHWNTVNINLGVNDLFLKELILNSYNLVFESLTKKLKDEILALH